jgi:hypothetical protein
MKTDNQDPEADGALPEPSAANLDPRDVIEAIERGIFSAITELDGNKIYEAIRQGVHDAIWAMIRSGTDMPCADFYDTIKEAAREAFNQRDPTTL